MVHLIENRSIPSQAEGVAREEAREQGASKNCKPIGVSMSTRKQCGNLGRSLRGPGSFWKKRSNMINLTFLKDCRFLLASQLPEPFSFYCIEERSQDMQRLLSRDSEVLLAPPPVHLQSAMSLSVLKGSMCHMAES